MATGTRVHRRLVSRKYRSVPYPLPSCNCEGIDEDMHQKCSKALEKEDWEDATCSVCLEYPHNAVLLLCSSHDKGCRPYMCATSYRYSNCLDQYEKANKKETSAHHGQPWHGSAEYTSVGFGSSEWPTKKCEGMELACPLCRGQVKGWTVVEAARKYLNAKKRNCMQDNCSFVGTYRELRKHVKLDHPSARPREVDPILEQKWKSLERERERDDVMSTIRSSMPGAMVLGDYVIERNHHNMDSDDEGAEDDDENYQMGFGNRSLLDVIFVLQTTFDQGNGRMNTGRREWHYREPLNREGVRRVSPSATSHGAVSSEGEDGNSSSLSQFNRGRVVRPGRLVRRRRRNQE